MSAPAPFVSREQRRRELRATIENPGLMPPVVCTDLAAHWCPIHGDCACPSDAAGNRWDLDSPDCPLHADGSDHAEVSS